MQHQHFTRDAANILRLDDWLRHLREGGELIHHAADIADMADDGIGTLLERVGIRGDFLGEAPLQPFSGKLDRGQRILYLVCDPARHVGPGGLALRGLQFGDVVKRDDEAIRPPGG